MTEDEFLISRALRVYNDQYGRDISMDDCYITSIAPNVNSDKAYEITTPDKSPYFRIRYYIKFGERDHDGWARLEVTPQYLKGVLGDEVYAIRGTVDSYWRSQYLFNPINQEGWPPGCILTEYGAPILSEDGLFMVAEHA